MKTTSGKGSEKKHHSRIPDYAIERMARCLLPDLIAYYESEEGQAAFAAWKAEKEKNGTDNGGINRGREAASCNTED